MKKGLLNCKRKMESELPADAGFLCDRPPVTGADVGNTIRGIRCTWLKLYHKTVQQITAYTDIILQLRPLSVSHGWFVVRVLLPS